MKTALSVPDDLFERAERFARRTRRSRSRLYTDAMREYLARHDPSAITAALDRVYAEDEPLDAVIAAVSARTLERVEW